jgi:hypothetical protein
METIIKPNILGSGPKVNYDLAVHTRSPARIEGGKALDAGEPKTKRCDGRIVPAAHLCLAVFRLAAFLRFGFFASARSPLLTTSIAR